MLLPEGEDLLQRLSGELGIPEFLDDLPMLEEAELPDANSFYETLMNDGSVFDTGTVLNMTLQVMYIKLYCVFCENLDFVKNFHQRFDEFL